MVNEIFVIARKNFLAMWKMIYFLIFFAQWKSDTLKIILFGLSSCEVTRAKQNEIYLHHKQEQKINS